MNSVNITARLTSDPQQVQTKGDTAVCNMRVAIDRMKREDGAVFVDIKTFGAQANAVTKYLSKGDPVAVIGRLELDQWQAQDGSKRSRVYVIAERVEFLGRPAGTDGRSAESQVASVAAAGDDEIPF
jgi:single-strand DNA-binding protein